MSEKKRKKWEDRLVDAMDQMSCYHIVGIENIDSYATPREFSKLVWKVGRAMVKLREYYEEEEFDKGFIDLGFSEEMICLYLKAGEYRNAGAFFLSIAEAEIERLRKENAMLRLIVMLRSRVSKVGPTP